MLLKLSKGSNLNNDTPNKQREKGGRKKENI